MVVSELFEKFRGGESQKENVEQGEPSHVCESCGEEYYADFTDEIETCRGCGGVKVERVK
jgi:ribosomal protein L37AE/L43A